MFVNLKINKIKTKLISCSQITLKEEKKNSNQYKLRSKLTLKGRPSNVPHTCGWIDPGVKVHRLYVVEPCWKR